MFYSAFLSTRSGTRTILQNFPDRVNELVNVKAIKERTADRDNSSNSVKKRPGTLTLRPASSFGVSIQC